MPVREDFSVHNAAHPMELRRIQLLPLPHQVDALLENPALLQRFPAEALYELICGIGLEDALELVQCATPAQFCTLVDLAAWRKDLLELAPLLKWLEAALGEDEEAFFAKLRHLDMEVLELLFSRAVHIKPAEEEEAEGNALEWMETADGRWRLEFLLGGEAQQLLRRTAEIWMGKNALEFSRFLEAVRWGLPSELEETAFLFRSARLEDLGFPPREEAVSLLAWVDTQAHRLAPEEPALAGTSKDFLEEGFKGLSQAQRLKLEAEARYLINTFLVAEGAEPGDVTAIYALSRQARDYLNLGFEHITSGQHTLFAQAAEQVGLRKIFQTGLSLTLELKRSLERLSQEPQAQWQKVWWTMQALLPPLSALGAKRPWLWKEGEKTMFKTWADIGCAKAQLEKAKRQMAVMAALHRNEPAKALQPFGAELRQLCPERFFCSAVAHFVAQGQALAKPFPADKLAVLEAKLCTANHAACASAFAHALLGEAAEGAVLEEAKEMAAASLGTLHAEYEAAKAKAGQAAGTHLFCLPIEGLPLRPL